MTDAVAEQPAPPRKLRRRPAGGRRALVALLLLIAIVALWYRSREHADNLYVFGSGGKVGGAMSLNGQVLVAFSDIRMGTPWTAINESQPAYAGGVLRDLLLNTPKLTQRWGFVVARHPADAFTLPGRWCSVVGVPHWALAPIPAWIVLAWVARRWRLWRRRRGGRCLACGYDLRGVDGRCPECGDEPEGSASSLTAPIPA